MKLTGLRIVLAAFVVGIAASACATATSSPASCAFIVGDGSYDSRLHKIVYPGQQHNTDYDYEDVWYVPCNSRNYIINDGTVKNANGDVLGDRDVLIKATTSTGVQIQIAARALWTLNQSDSALRNFYNVCFKYTCASNQDQSGDANFSTPGWNGMLAENFGPGMDGAARVAAITANDSIWQTHDPEEYKALGDRMSAAFGDQVRANLGYSEDLFCGSGNSNWSDPNNPGTGTFTCSPVRIIVDDVQRVAIEESDSTAGAIAINKQRLENAKVLYGPEAGIWLALQDMCAASKACYITVGNGLSPFGAPVPSTIDVQGSSSAATPTP